jgi:hypothetical protein
MAGKLADGTSLADYNKAARERQARGEFDEAGAREAIDRVRGRQTQAYSSRGEMMPGQSGGAFNPPKPPPPAKKPAQAVAKPAEPARQVAAMPKSQDHASPAKPAVASAAPSPAAKPADSRPPHKIAEDEGRARIAQAQAMLKNWKNDDAANASARAKADEEYNEKQETARAEAKEGQEKYRQAQRRLDERAATPGPIKAAKAVGEGVGAGLKGLYHTARGTANLGAAAAKPVAKAGYRWLTGDPEAKKRLANAQK